MKQDTVCQNIHQFAMNIYTYCIQPDGISGAYIIVVIIKLSFVMIPQVVRTVMQQRVREISSVFKAIKMSCRCV